MKLSTDPDTLRIPAFMRRKNIRARAKKPLLLTALDRKKAGILPEGISKKIEREKRPVMMKNKKMTLKKPKIRVFRKEADKIDFKAAGRSAKFEARNNKPAGKIASAVRSRPRLKPARSETFSAPLLDFSPPIIEEAPSKKLKAVGTLTHYYDKIKVGVIKLCAPISVGDCITYETPDEPYEQIVESMEIDRVPVFKAGRGKEIGLKLHKIPRIGSRVLH